MYIFLFGSALNSGSGAANVSRSVGSGVSPAPVAAGSQHEIHCEAGGQQVVIRLTTTTDSNASAAYAVHDQQGNFLCGGWVGRGNFNWSNHQLEPASLNAIVRRVGDEIDKREQMVDTLARRSAGLPPSSDVSPATVAAGLQARLNAIAVRVGDDNREQMVDTFVSHFKQQGYDEARLRALAVTHHTTIQEVVERMSRGFYVTFRDLLTIHSKQASAPPLDLGGWDLSNCNLSQIPIINVHFNGAQLSGVQFEGAFLKDCSFDGCTATEVNFSGCTADHCSFVGSKFDQSNVGMGETCHLDHDINAYRHDAWVRRYRNSTSETKPLFWDCDLSNSCFNCLGSGELILHQCELKSVSGNWPGHTKRIVNCTMDASVAGRLLADSTANPGHSAGLDDYTPSHFARGIASGGKAIVTLADIAGNWELLRLPLVFKEDDQGIDGEQAFLLMREINRLTNDPTHPDDPTHPMSPDMAAPLLGRLAREHPLEAMYLLPTVASISSEDRTSAVLELFLIKQRPSKPSENIEKVRDIDEMNDY